MTNAENVESVTFNETEIKLFRRFHNCSPSALLSVIESDHELMVRLGVLSTAEESKTFAEKLRRLMPVEELLDNYVKRNQDARKSRSRKAKKKGVE